MARGFDSKFVEAQQEEASRTKVMRPALSADEQARVTRREALQMARTRAADDLLRATAPAHRAMLEQAIAALEGQLAALGGE